jgi:uncharacterized ubiquitin-like protein YukD
VCDIKNLFLSLTGRVKDMRIWIMQMIKRDIRIVQEIIAINRCCKSKTLIRFRIKQHRFISQTGIPIEQV